MNRRVACAWPMLVLVGGCDWLFGVRSFGSPDGGATGDGIANSDGAHPVCASPPDFAAATYAGITPFGVSGGAINHPTRAGAQVSYDYQGKIVLADVHGNMENTPASLAPAANQADDSPSFSPDANNLWFTRTDTSNGLFVGLLHAVDGALGWNEGPTTVESIPTGTQSIQASTPAVYSGTFRMVLAIQTGSYYRLYEATSPDGGTTFQNVTALLFNGAGAYDDRDPYLSPDGCYLLFSSSRSSSFLQIYIATRTVTGDWTMPMLLPVDAAATQNVWQPTVGPDGTTLWFIDNAHLYGPT